MSGLVATGEINKYRLEKCENKEIVKREKRRDEDRRKE
jgi:hypothetical protein